MKLLFRIFSIIAISFQLYHPTFANSDRVQSAGKKKWAKGYIVGKIAKIAKQGYIFKTFEADFVTAGEDGNEKTKFVPVTMKISTKVHEVFERLTSASQDEVLVLEYSYTHPLNIFRIHDSRYMITKVHNLSDFKESESFKNFGAELDVGDKGHHGRYGIGTRSGKVFHVSRWGYIGTTCTAYFNLGGMKTIKVPIRNDKGEVIAHTTKDIPNVEGMNVYTEKGCRYLEDLVKGGITQVKLNVQQYWFEIWNHYVLTIKNIKVE